MWPYLVVCELAEPARYATALDLVLRDLGARRLLAPAWLLNSDLNAKAILELLRAILPPEDRLFVTELADDMAGANLETPLPWN